MGKLNIANACTELTFIFSQLQLKNTVEMLHRRSCRFPSSDLCDISLNIYIYIFRFTIVQSVFPRGISFNYSESDVALALAEFSGYVPFLCLEFCWCGTRGTCPYLQYGRDSAPSISRALQAFINPLIIIIFISFCWFLQLRDLCGCHGCFHSV